MMSCARGRVFPGLVGQGSDFGSDYGEAPARVSGMSRLDRRVHRQEVGLIGGFLDAPDGLADVAHLILERVDRVERFGKLDLDPPRR
jgi:hypothetical protein